jgi:GNAT superfamily N-acetyltransferase
MNPGKVLAAYDEQIRRHPEPDAADGHIEYDDGVIRSVSPAHAWTGVTWSDLNQANVDAAIAAQLARFVDLGTAWEWKYYSYDQPTDLPDRLLAAGFRPQPTETLLVADIADLDLAVLPPMGVELVAVADEAAARALADVHDEVFGTDGFAVGKTVLADLERRPGSVAAVVAMAGSTPIAGGRIEFHAGSDFASIWGGGTLPAWRGRGVFRSLVARRAAMASTRGFRYLQVDASAASKPILQRLGFHELATTTPFTHPAITG